MNPFKFLDSYTKNDKDIFFGRNQEIDELYHKVFESKILLVYGISGTGKTSLINCGLANRFNDTDWLPVNIRRGNNLSESLLQTLNKIALVPISIAKGKDNAQRIIKALHSVYLDHFKPVYLIFDHFEELFIFGTDEEKQEFLNVLKGIVQSDLQCKLIFVIRKEYFAGIAEFESIVPEIMSNRMRLEKMTRANARLTITEPCKMQNIEVEDGFADTLLDKLDSRTINIDLTYLQVALDKIYKLAKSESEKPGLENNLRFTVDLLDKLGNVNDLLGAFLEEQISQMPDPVSALTVLKAFVSTEGTKRQITEEEVLNYALSLGKDITSETIKYLILRFIKLRILRDKDENGRYELRHDALASKIYEKITLVEKEILEVRQFIENSWNNWQKRNILLSTADLAYIAPYKSRLYLSKELTELLEKSKKVLLKAKRRRRIAAIAVSITLLVVFAGFTLWALDERGKAFVESRHSKIILLVAKAKEAFANNPTKAMRYAQLAYQHDSTNVLASQTLSDIFNKSDANPFYVASLNHHDNVSSAVFSPDGKKLLTASWDNTAKLWDLTGKCMLTFQGHSSRINSAVFSPNGQNILTASNDKTARLWDLNGKCLTVFYGDTSEFTSAVFSPDGKTILSTSTNLSAKLWNLYGKCLATLSGHTDNVRSAVFSRDGKYILTSSWDKTAKLWNLSGKCMVTLTGHKSFVVSANFSPDGKNILTSSWDKTAKLWDLKGKCLKTFKGHEEFVLSAVFSSNGKLIVTTSGDKTAKLWNLSGKCLTTFSGHSDYVSSAVFSADGKNILTASVDKTAKLWDLSGKCLATFSGHSSKLNSAAFSPDGRTILTASVDKTAKVWDLSVVNLPVLQGHSDKLKFAAFSPTGQFVLTASNSKVILWDICGKFVATLAGHKGAVINALFAPDGKSILTVSSEKIAIWDLKGKSLKTIYADTAEFTSAAFALDSKTFVTGLSDHTAKLWDIHGNVLQILKGHHDLVFFVRFSSDGKTILTISYDQTTRLWDLKGKCLDTLSWHTPSVSLGEFSPDCKTSLIVSSDQVMKLWDNSDHCLAILSGHSSLINSVVFSSDGKYVLTASNDNTAKLWDLTGKCLATFSGHAAKVNSAVFSPNNNTILTASSDNTAKLWDLSGRCLATYSGHSDIVRYADFSHNGKNILTVSNDNLAKIWLTPPAIYKWISNSKIGTLSISDKAEIGELDDFNEIKFSDKTELLDDYADWYLSNSDTLKAVILYERAMKLSPGGFGRKILGDIYRAKNQKEKYLNLFKNDPLTILKDEIGDYKERTISDSYEGKYLYFSQLAKLYEKLLMMEPGGQAKYEAATCYNDIGWNSLFTNNYADGLKAIQRGIELDSSNDMLFVNLPLCYLFAGEIDKANELYLAYKDKPWTADNRSKTFKESFLDDITNLERNGVSHPDFIKVKKILTEKTVKNKMVIRKKKVK